MKYLFTLILALAIFMPGKAGNDKYVKAMEGILSDLDSAKTPEQFTQVANRLERIAQAEPKEWLPPYYASFCYVMMSYMVQPPSAETDAKLDKAQEFLDQAKEIKKADMSEIWVLQGMIYSARIGVEPQTRGMKFGPQAGMAFGKAKGLNEENPRAWSMMAQNTFFTPKQFGGGKEKALPMFEKAMELFDSVEPASSIDPKWGRENCEQMYQFATSDQKMPWQEEMEEGAGEDAEEEGE